MVIAKEHLIARIYKALEVMQKTREFYLQANVSFPKIGDFDKLACEELQIALIEMENDEIRFANERISHVETYHLYPHHDYLPIQTTFEKKEKYDIPKEILELKHLLTAYQIST